MAAANRGSEQDCGASWRAEAAQTSGRDVVGGLAGSDPDKPGEGHQSLAVRQSPEGGASLKRRTSPLEDAAAKVNGQAPDQKPEPAYRPLLFNSAEFDDADFRLTWLIKRLLVKDQPCIVGGPRKALKTNTLIDLALSIGSGTPFLGEFRVYEKLPTLLLSGESGEAVIQETARRVCQAKGISLRDCEVSWGFSLPQLGNPTHMDNVKKLIKERGIQVVIVDPLYLCLIAAGAKIDAANLFDMGPLLRAVSDSCREAGATPILAHHFRKNVSDPHDPAQLEELAYAGVQEFARQWLLINRRQAYDPDDPVHRLWLQSGGSAGHSGLWAVDIDEGKLADDFTGRIWNVSITSGKEAKEKCADEKTRKKESAQTTKEKTHENKVIEAIRAMEKKAGGPGATLVARNVRTKSKLNNNDFNGAIDRLEEQGFLTSRTEKVDGLNGTRNALVVTRVVSSRQSTIDDD